MNTKKRILVAMSGGVDSSVAAALLAEQGHEVIGVTLRLLPRGGEGFGCCGSPDDMVLAKRSAERVGVPHYVLDYSPEFEDKVINYFVDAYVSGETPNPCLACNRYIKFDRLKVFAKSINADYLATGHYARVTETDGRFHLWEAATPEKDQSYVLYNFDQAGLGMTLFPVGHAPKPEIREMARRFGLPNAEKKDSQEICFVPGRDYGSFVKRKLEERAAEAPESTRPGPIVDTAGQVIGEHKGIAFYTVGQRNGLGLSVNQRMYVTRLEGGSNTVVVGTDNQSLCQGLNAAGVTWVAGEPPAAEFDALAKIRYKHQPTPARIRVEGDRVTATFVEGQRAVSPGQAAVFYRFDPSFNAREVLGGGKITQALL